MKLCVRKIYCNSCKTLVSCQEKKTEVDIQVSCSRCNTVLYVWNSVRWAHPGSTSSKTTAIATKAAKAAPAIEKPAKKAPASEKTAAPAEKPVKTSPAGGKPAKSAASSSKATKTQKPSDEKK